MENFYKILNVQPTAKDTELKEALHTALRLWSNRTNAPQMDRRQEAERMVKVIEEAETILLNPAKRAEYDRNLKSAPPPLPHENRAAVDSATNLIEEARRLLAEGNLGDALYAATKATEREGGNPEAWALLGRAHFRLRDVEGAIYEYNRAIKLKPNEGDYYSELGDIYDDTGKLDDALTQYRKAAQVEPAVPFYRAQVGYVLQKQGNIPEAIEILEQCVKEEPDSEAFRYDLGVAYYYGCRQSWTFVPEGGNVPSGYYPTSKANILKGLEFLNKAESMKSDALKESISNSRRVIKESLERRFYGNKAAAVVGGIAWTVIGFGAGLIIAPFYFYASRPPVYAIHKRLIAGEASGTDKAMQASDKVAKALTITGYDISGFMRLVVFAYTAALLPVMAVVNYVKNYTGENNTKDINI